VNSSTPRIMLGSPEIAGLFPSYGCRGDQQHIIEYTASDRFLGVALREERHLLGAIGLSDVSEQQGEDLTTMRGELAHLISRQRKRSGLFFGR
jgi:hypothetical protein